MLSCQNIFPSKNKLLISPSARCVVLLIILLLPPFFSYLRIPARKLQLSKEAWSKALCSPGTATTNPYSNCLEVLQIQPSKVAWTKTSRKIASLGFVELSSITPLMQMKLGDRYLQMNAYTVMLMENIQAHIIFTLLKWGFHFKLATLWLNWVMGRLDMTDNKT